MIDNKSDRTVSYEVMKIRERAAAQREAFKRTHGSGSTAFVPEPDPVAEEQSPGYHYSYQPGYVDPSKKLHPEQREKGGSMPVISLILGVISILIFWTMPLAMLIALAGIIMSVHVIGKNNDRGLGMAALITSIIGMILALILTGFVIMNSSRILRAFDEINNQIREEYGEEFFDDQFGSIEGMISE